MKLSAFVFFMLTAGWLCAQQNFYEQSTVSSTGDVVTMSIYKGKKLLIVVASPDALIAKSSARYLGQIQSSFPEIEVLVLPFNRDTSGKYVSDAKPSNIIKNTRFSALITADKSGQQNPILKWMTHLHDNLHFDRPIDSDEMFYVISASGVLYAVLDKGISDSLLKIVLTEDDVKPQDIITDINRKN